jgi:ribosomal protein L29
MKATTLKDLEKRVAALEESLAQLMQSQPQQPMKFKDWRIAVARVKRTELAEEVDAAGRKIREADRRKARRA